MSKKAYAIDDSKRNLRDIYDTLSSYVRSQLRSEDVGN